MMKNKEQDIVKDYAAASSSRSEILLAEDLRKSYGPRQALRGLSFSLERGRILGFLGPNGAGKTTAIRILTTILEPSSGSFVVDGVSSAYPQKIRQKIGVLPESLGFPKSTTAIEFLTYFGRLYGLPANVAKKNALALLEEVGLGQRARSLIGSYSRGMRQRLGIARALVNDPVVLFLDEPTLGLDPRGQQELLELVRRIAHEREVGIILCSHALSEIEVVCDDVVILSVGQVVAKGTVTDVIERAQQGALQSNVLRIQVPTAWVSEAQTQLEALPNVVQVTNSGKSAGWLRLELEDQTDGPAAGDNLVNNRILGTLIQGEIPILSFEAEGGRLQSVFLHLTEENGGVQTDG